MKWISIVFDDAIGHVAPADLVADLVLDMAKRGHPIKDYASYGAETAAALGGNPKAVTEWAFDIGGMWTVGQPIEHIELDGLDVEIASDHVSEVRAQLSRCVTRRFDSGVEYRKLKLWHHATVMTIHQQILLDVTLSNLELRALERASRFFAGRDKESRDA